MRARHLLAIALAGAGAGACAGPTAAPPPGPAAVPGSRLAVVRPARPGWAATPADVAAHLAATDGARIHELPPASVAQAAQVATADGGTAAMGLGRRNAREANARLLADAAHLDELALLAGHPGAAPGLPALGPPAPLALPPHVDFRAELPPARAQGDRPTCEMFAACAALDHLARGDAAAPVKNHSPQFLWWNYERLVNHALSPSQAWGGMGSDGLHLAMVLRREGNPEAEGPPTVPPEQGVVDEALAPYVAEARGIERDADPVAIARGQLGATADRILAGEALPASGATAVFLKLDLPTLKLALSEGRAVVIGYPVHGEAWQAAGRDGRVPELNPADAADTGGHAVLLVGYEDDPARPGGGDFVFRNSWGPGWGDGGHGRASYRMTLDYADDPYVLVRDPRPFAGRFTLGYVP